MKKVLNPEEIRAIIEEKLPHGLVIPRHNERGHFYEIDEASITWLVQRFYEEGYVLPRAKIPVNFDGAMITGVVLNNPVYPSVTAKLHVLKDEGLMNYKMNKAIEYVFANYKNFTDANIMEELDKASRISQDNLEQAGDIGTWVHQTREDIFNKWIETGKRPEDFLAFIKPEYDDIRVVSCIRALQKFCVERDYIPVRCELLVYNRQFKIAGTLDDLGLIRKVLREGDKDCQHTEMLRSEVYGASRCLRCDYKCTYEFCLMDLKTSNAFKDHYFFQVAMYNWMFKKLTGLNPTRLFILKVSKEDGTYRVEDIRKPTELAKYSRYMLKTNEGIEFIKSLRKDNQKVVAPLMQL